MENGRTVRANAIANAASDVHALYGGVVPEIASRMHVEAIDPLLDAALSEANMTLNDVDAIAVTYGPGLVGALLTGVSWAKALAYARHLPLIPVNHIEGHVPARIMWRIRTWNRRSCVPGRLRRTQPYRERHAIRFL